MLRPDRGTGNPARWEAADIDLTRDGHDWRRLSDPEQDLLLRLTALLGAGDDSVALDLLPRLLTAAEDQRLEEELFLTSFLWEEAKHVEMVRRFFTEVAQTQAEPERYESPSYKVVCHEALPLSLSRLLADDSCVARAEALLTYNVMVLGVVVETACRAYEETLRDRDILPGMRKALSCLRQDECRHVEHGVTILGRLLAEEGDCIGDAIDKRVGELRVPALGVIAEALGAYAEPPFGLKAAQWVDAASARLEQRLASIRRG